MKYDIFKGLLILTEFGKFGRKFRQICQIYELSLSFEKLNCLRTGFCDGWLDFASTEHECVYYGYEGGCLNKKTLEGFFQ